MNRDDEHTEASDGPRRLRGYYAALDAGNIEAALAVFALEAVYVRAEKVGVVVADQATARQLVVSRGRDEIRDFMQRQDDAARARGAAIRHEILAITYIGRRCFVDGVVPSPDGALDVVFFAHAVFDTVGLVRYYAAVANESPPNLLAKLLAADIDHDH